uniref:Solute carrier family 15 member 1 n=1 Tax=Junco hyemalis TaxID=40217 RepID=A0A8C5J9X0_JUNHY
LLIWGIKTMSVLVLCFGFPLSIFFIVINEFCERFSYYGMKAVLTLYFTRFLHWEDNFATAIYHTFVALCYLTPILGAIIADSWLGKFKTILYLSIVYIIGQAVLTVSSINDLTDHNQDVALYTVFSQAGQGQENLKREEGLATTTLMCLDQKISAIQDNSRQIIYKLLLQLLRKNHASIQTCII